MRIGIGVFSHEANSFCPRRTTYQNFERHWLKRGSDMLRDLQGVNIEESGALDVLGAETDVEIVPLFAARALSGAPIVDDEFRILLAELLGQLRENKPLDGVLLALHGAMMSDEQPDATGRVLEATRNMLGENAVIVGTLDLHANVTPWMLEKANALIGYHTAPHVDLREAGAVAARLLLHTLRGEIKPTMALARLPMILPPENALSTHGPLAEVINMALEAEQRGKALHVSVYPVQPWLDTPDVASSVLVVSDGDAEEAQKLANKIAKEFWARREQFIPQMLSPDEAVARALARESGPVVLCDSADSPTSGSTGDSTVILQALLRAAPIQPTALLNIVDPWAVVTAVGAGIGNKVTVPVGGRLAPTFFKPVSFTGKVKTITNGAFTFQGPGMRGTTHHMGRTVVLEQGGIHLVVMERAVSQWDPQLYRSLNEEPAEARIVQVKSPAAFRAAYGPLAAEILLVRSPGPSSSDFAALPWKHIGRPIYPLDAKAKYPPRKRVTR